MPIVVRVQQSIDGMLASISCVRNTRLHIIVEHHLGRFFSEINEEGKFKE